MSDNGHRIVHSADSCEEWTQVSAHRTKRNSAVPSRIGKWMWVVGVATTLASMSVLLMGQEPSAFNYIATSALLGSMGLLAFVSASRALNVGARYEESVLHVERVERRLRSLRQVVSTAMDLRDNVTGGHSDRVVKMSLALGRRMGLTDERLHHLEWAAFLHDIGKIHVAEGILTKPAALDAGEWSEMQQHPSFSYFILAQVEPLSEAAEIVYCHHERYDGMGYPRFLKRAEIPLEARIFSVADAYDAMVSERPYRRPVSHDQAVREVVSHAGTQFDPLVVTAFIDWAVQAGGESTRQVVEAEVQRLPSDLLRLEPALWA